jgi:hypothetical protein
MNIKKFNDFVNEAKYEEDNELNRILDKISAQGIDSITPAEKAYLDGDSVEEETDDEEDEYELMDDDGNYINPSKENYIFKVFDNEEQNTYGDVGVAVFDKNDKYMIDIHVSDELFPEIKEIGLEDLTEGVLEYSGKLSKEELVDKLKSMGFNARLENIDDSFSY